MPRKIKPTENYFGRRLAALRKQRGITQTQLGETVGVSQRVIAYYERETSHVPANLLSLISRALQVSADTLLGLEPAKEDGRTVDARFMRKWTTLSGEDKKAVEKVVDALAAKV